MTALPQHMQALNHANDIRTARCALKRRLRTGEVHPADVLNDQPPEAATMSVLDLLQSQHRWGRARALRLLRKAAMSETKRLGELTVRQRSALALYLLGQAHEDDLRGWWS